MNGKTQEIYETFNRLSFIIKNNRLIFNGLSFGYGDSNPFLKYKTNHYIIIRVPSTREWSSIGQTSSFPSTWYLVQYEKTDDCNRIVKIISRKRPGRFWSRCQRELIQNADDNERQEIYKYANKTVERKG